MGPHTGQARQHIVIPGKLHLHLGVRGLGPLGENFQDEACPVNDVADFYDFLYVPLLYPGQFIVKDYVLDTVILAVLGNFLQLTAFDICGIVRLVQPLDKVPVSVYSGRLGQETQFLKVFKDFPLLVFPFNYAYEYCFFFHISQKKAILLDSLIIR